MFWFGLVVTVLPSCFKMLQLNAINTMKRDFNDLLVHKLRTFDNLAMK